MHFHHTSMSQMNWGAFDLNLLIVFDAVMQERSVTRAGQRIGLSQPAISHALGRLRHMLKDELFIRAPDGMVPTPRAEALAQPLRNALTEMHSALEPVAFDPAVTDRRFVLAVSNYVSVVIGPPLITAVSAAAPSVVLDLRPSDTMDVVARLDRGDIDLALGDLKSPGERFEMATLLEERFAMVMRRGHPARHTKLSAKSFADLPHLELSSTDRDISFIDTWLAERGMARRIGARAPFLSAAAILVQSDMVATLTHRIAEELVRSYPLEILNPPYDSPPAHTTMLWHRRLNHHPAHRWLRTVIQSLSKSL